MTIINLSKNEKVVLYSLVKAPLLNDRQISSHTGIKMSTITAIRNRLHKRKLYTTVRIPLLPPKLCEVLFLSMDPLTQAKGKQRPTLVKEICEGVPEIALCSLDTDVLTIGMARNLSDYHLARQNFLEGLCQKGLYQRSTGEDLVFARQWTEVLNLFDHSHLLSLVFQRKDGLELPVIKTTVPNPTTGPVISTSVEKKVFLGLIGHPHSADTKLAESVHITRQIIAKLRGRFEREGLMRTVRLVNLKRLGFQVMVHASFNFDPQAAAKSRRRALRNLSSDMPVIFSVTDALKGSALMVFADFQEANGNLSSLSENFKHGEILCEPPEYNYLSIPDQKLAQFHNWAPLIEKILAGE